MGGLTMVQKQADSPVNEPSPLHIRPGFAVPVVFGNRADDGLNAELRDLFIAREAEGPRHANPNPYTQRNTQLFESNFDLFKWTEPCITRLRDFCWDSLTRTVAGMNAYDEAFIKKLRIGADAWFHVTRRGGYFGIHNHPMAAWSGVYCVSGGRHDPDSPDSGLLNFINPFVMNTMFVDAGNAHLQEPYSMNSRSYRLEAGQLVMFPSWLLHEVKPFLGEGERITVAFNAWFHVAK